MAHLELGRALSGGVAYPPNCADCPPWLRAQLGHDGAPQLYRDHLLTGARLAECPARTLERAADRDPRAVAEASRYRDVYFPLYEAGHLLAGGGIADQPARWLAGMQRLTTLRRASERKVDEVRSKERGGDG